ncbi:MAG: FimV family protein [Halioglobus sp.]
MARKLATVVFSLGCLHASSLMALGLGEIELDSFLNEPLNASVDLLNVGSLHQDEIKVRLATREDFDRMGLERAFFLTNIEFEVVMDSKGRGHIKMSSDEPVLEPYLDFLVEARWPSGRLLREYTVLIDPPVFAESGNVVSASKRVEEVEGIPAPAKKKSAGGNGTSVNVKKSNLAPGSMPQRDYNSAAAGAPSSGSRYMISRDDTLWTIASRAQPEGVSVYQTMLEIQRLNPNAFINGNINRVKAGYIIYLPTADDVSSGDPAAALAEVNEQNAAWREQRDAELYASRGPKLKISAEPGDAGTPDSVGGSSAGGMTSGLESAVGSSQAGSDTSGQLAAMQQQLETMQRIVNLKDEQIAALQNALTETEESAQDIAEPADLEALEAAAEAAAEESDIGQGAEGIIDAMESTAESVVEDVDSAAEEAAEEAAAAAAALKADDAQKPKKPSKPKITTKPLPPEPATNWLMYGLYALGGLLVAGLAFLFVRRRRNVEDDYEEEEVIADDVFSDVELQEQELEVEDFDETDLEEDIPVAASAASEGKQGYGSHRHDEYASDVEASDALAEADIYIAYGRHPQAIDLLNNALSNEPNNPVYRLKLIEVYTELGDRGAAAAQLEQLQSLGNAEATAQGEAIYNNEPSSDNFEAQVGAGGSADLGDEFDELLDEDQGGPGLTPNPLSMDDRLDDGLENEFSGLEIEDADDEGELDLSSDFEPAGGDDDEEELVIAADANGLSTKMDLARAYIDMGDEDGARQILEEVVSEGSDELRLEAETLLDRIGG